MESFYKTNWEAILQSVRDRADGPLEQFSREYKTVAPELADQLHDWLETPMSDFERNCMIDREKFMVDPVAGYEWFMNFTDNTPGERKEVRPHPAHDILEAISKNSQWPEVPAAEMYNHPQDPKFPLETLLEVFKDVTGFAITHVAGEEYECRDVDSDTLVGIFYILSTPGQPCTTILMPPGFGVPKMAIVSPLTAQLCHELAHSVHFSKWDYWDISRDYCEIPSMAIERMCRERLAAPWSPNKARMGIALALADLNSTTAAEFNAAFARYGRFTNAGNIASRFWHYYVYDKKYWTYVLGTYVDQPARDLLDRKNMDSDWLSHIVKS